MMKTNRSANRTRSRHVGPLFGNLTFLAIQVLIRLTPDAETYSFQLDEWKTFLPDFASSRPLGLMPTYKKTIAYAVTLTSCNEQKRLILMDYASVVHQSVKLAHRKSQKYDYTMIAFVHPDATYCSQYMKRLGYNVQVRDTPFNETLIPEPLRTAQGNSCCGAKEYLKLYSYLQTEYPIVVHLDLDTMVLQAMDDVFDLMLEPDFNRSKISAMWQKPDEIPKKVDFLFTRDYNMVSVGRRQPYQIGVQGGLLVVRPNETDFHRLVGIIMSGGDFDTHSGWGGPLKYGGYYGAGTIQGLASYYYGHFEPNRSLELNRCYYNQMVDNPHEEVDGRKMCLTLEESCQDCRNTDLKDIYTAHFTECGKPVSCWIPKSWHDMPPQDRLCLDLFREWHLVRLSLENEWKSQYSGYYPVFYNISLNAPDNHSTEHYDLYFHQGHCESSGRYVPMTFPFAHDDTGKETYI